MLPLIYHPIYSELDLPEGHRYPITKYRHLFQAVCQQREHDDEWRERTQFVEPRAITVEQVKTIHADEYVDALVTGRLPAAKMRRIGFPWSEQLIKRTLTSSAGTIETVKQAVLSGCAIHLSGGYHHAHHEFGSGFCLFNDLVLAADHAIQELDIEKVMIIDSDVHHGDGTATLCDERDDIITVSFHCDKNFPARKPDSDLDVPLARGCTDNEFLTVFEEVVEMAIRLHQPDLVIYDAGVDIHTDDELGFFNVSIEGIYQRDKLLFSMMKKHQLPVACVVGGGYRTEHSDLVLPHMQLIKAALK